MAESMMDSLRKLKGLLAEHDAMGQDLQRRLQLAKAQEDYCAAHGLPHFAPKTGICWSCGKDATRGRHDWTREHITCCEGCNRSFCS